METHTGSVFDFKRMRYYYFKCPGANSVGGWKPLTGLGIPSGKPPPTGLGRDILDVLPSLPKDARYLGWGHHAIGRVYALRDNKRRPPVKPVRRVRRSAPHRGGLGEAPDDVEFESDPISATAGTMWGQAQSFLPDTKGREKLATFVGGMMVGAKWPNARWLIGLVSLLLIGWRAAKGDYEAQYKKIQAQAAKAGHPLPDLDQIKKQLPGPSKSAAPTPPQDALTGVWLNAQGYAVEVHPRQGGGWIVVQPPQMQQPLTQGDAATVKQWLDQRGFVKTQEPLTRV